MSIYTLCMGEKAQDAVASDAHISGSPVVAAPTTRSDFRDSALPGAAGGAGQQTPSVGC